MVLVHQRTTLILNFYCMMSAMLEYSCVTFKPSMLSVCTIFNGVVSTIELSEIMTHLYSLLVPIVYV